MCGPEHENIPQRPQSKCIVVNCSQTRYHVVRAAALQLGWCLEDDNRDDVPETFHGVSLRFDTQPALERVALCGKLYDPSTTPQIIWVDKSVLHARVAALSCYHRINHFPGMNVIARKAVLFRRLMRIRRRLSPTSTLGENLNCFPWSFAPATDCSLMNIFIEQLHESGVMEPFFIIKPNKGCEGKGIIVTPDPLTALEGLTPSVRDDCLVQQYVSPPLCIDHKKFDLRIYVLVQSVVNGCPPRRGLRRTPGNTPIEAPRNSHTSGAVGSPLDGLLLYVHKEGLVRICAEPYAAPTRGNCHKANIHLTNYAVNKSADDFSVGHATNGEGICEGNKRDFAYLKNYITSLSAEGESSAWESLLRRIDTAILLTMLSGWENLQREFISTGASRGSRSDGRNCFEILGFDLMLTDKLEPIVIEVNHSPSLFCETTFDFETKRRVVADVFRLLEPYIPSVEQCTTTRYAAHEANAVKREATDSFGFRQISPQRENEPWSEKEMCVFEEMLRLVQQC